MVFAPLFILGHLVLIGSHESIFFVNTICLVQACLGWNPYRVVKWLQRKWNVQTAWNPPKAPPTPKPCKARRRLVSFINHWQGVKDQGTQVKPHLEKATFVDWRPCCRGGHYLGEDNMSKPLTAHVVHVQSKITVRADLMLPGNRLGFICLHTENGVIDRLTRPLISCFVSNY